MTTPQSPPRQRLEMSVRLTGPEALHGILSVLHARSAKVLRLQYDDTTVRMWLACATPQLVFQLERRVDVVDVVLTPRSTVVEGAWRPITPMIGSNSEAPPPRP